jgi:hypothetical protein
MTKRPPYLHNSRNLHLIAAAAKMDADNAAVLSIQKPNGITDGGIASIFFSGIDWPTASRSEREQMLKDWLRYELQNSVEAA